MPSNPWHVGAPLVRSLVRQVTSFAGRSLDLSICPCALHLASPFSPSVLLRLPDSSAVNGFSSSHGSSIPANPSHDLRHHEHRLRVADVWPSRHTLGAPDASSLQRTHLNSSRFQMILPATSSRVQIHQVRTYSSSNSKSRPGKKADSKNLKKPSGPPFSGGGSVGKQEVPKTAAASPSRGSKVSKIVGGSKLKNLERLILEREKWLQKEKRKPQSDTHLASLRLKLAQEYLEDGSPEEAEELAISSLEFYQKSGEQGTLELPQAHHLIGQCKFQEGNFQEAGQSLIMALSSVEKCLDKTPPATKDKSSGRPLGQTKDKTVEAPGQRNLSAAMALQFSCFTTLGVVSELQGDLDFAAEMHSSAVNLVSDNPDHFTATDREDAHFGLARTLVELKRAEDALRCFREGGLGLTTVDVDMDEEGWSEEMGEGEWEKMGRRVRDKDLLARIFAELGYVRKAAREKREVREVLLALGAPSLDLASFDLETGDLLSRAIMAAKADGWPRDEEGEGEEDDETVEDLEEEAVGLVSSAVRVQRETLDESDPSLLSTLIKAAEACFEVERGFEAMQFCKEAVALFDQFKDWRAGVREKREKRGEGKEVSEGEGEQKGDEEEVEEEEAEEEEEIEQQREMMGRAAWMLVALDDVEGAADLVKRIESALLDEGWEEEALYVMLDQAQTLLMRNKGAAALSLLEQLEVTYRAVLAQSTEKKVDFLLTLSHALKLERSVDEAFIALEKARSAVEEEGPGGQSEDASLWMRVHGALVAHLVEAKRFQDAARVQESIVNVLGRVEGKESEVYAVELKRLEQLKQEEKMW